MLTVLCRKSCIMGWRLFAIIAAYCDCSEMFRPYLFKYLETTANDTQRTYSGASAICLQNLRKTFKFGGRKNVPLKEEINALAVSASCWKLLSYNHLSVIPLPLHNVCVNLGQMQTQTWLNEWFIVVSNTFYPMWVYGCVLLTSIQLLMFTSCDFLLLKMTSIWFVFSQLLYLFVVISR